MVTIPSSISKADIIQKVFENIYDRLVDDVKTVNITGNVDVTIKTYTNSFPDKPMDEKSDYPIMIISVPDLSWETLTINKKWANGRFMVEIYTTQAESADKFATAIQNSIETYRDKLKSVNLSFVNLDSISPDQFNRGSIKVHSRTLDFSFKYTFTGTI